MKHLGNLMLDLETMGNAQNSAIVSIGAVEFDLNTGETGEEFYERVNLQSCLDKGLIVNGSTVYWWLEQNETARKNICKSSDSLQNVLNKLTFFMHCLGEFKI
jgi:DNA polymerase III epsilon subunit-like protein